MAITEVKWNASLKGGNATIGKDGLSALITDLSNNIVISSIGKIQGKYYCEIKLKSDSYKTSMIGVCTKDIDIKGSYSQSCSWLYYAYDGQKYNGSTHTSYGSGYVAEDVIGVALDLINRTIEFYKNGVSQGIAYDNLPKGEMFICVTNASGSYQTSVIANFGNTPFKYSIPKGYYPYNLEPFNFLLRKDSQHYTIKGNELLLLESQILDKDNFTTNGFANLDLITQENTYYNITKQNENNVFEYDLNKEIAKIEMI